MMDRDETIDCMEDIIADLSDLAYDGAFDRTIKNRLDDLVWELREMLDDFIGEEETEEEEE